MTLHHLLPASLALLSLFSSAAASAVEASDTPTLDASRIDLPRLISCQDSPENFLRLAIATQDPLQAVALGWRPLPQTNMFMSEYALTQPITVLGHRTEHIAFAGSSVMAVLDLPDPRPLARELQLETALDTPEKAMFGKEVLSESFVDPDGLAQVRSAVLNVSNVTSHPGKTLLGCTYSIDPEEEPVENPDPIAAPATH